MFSIFSLLFGSENALQQFSVKLNKLFYTEYHLETTSRKIEQTKGDLTTEPI